MKKALIFLVFISFILFSCKTVKVETDQQKVSKTKQLTQEEAVQNTALFIDANREKILGNLDKAMSLLAQCIKKNPEYDAAMYEMAMILNQKKQYNEALIFAKKAVKIDTENKWYKLLLGDIYEKKSDYENAIKVFSDLMNKYPTSIEYFYEVANLYLAVGNYNEALKTYDLLEKQIGVEEDVSLGNSVGWAGQSKEIRSRGLLFSGSRSSFRAQNNGLTAPVNSGLITVPLVR